MKKIWVISLGGSVLLSEPHHRSFLLSLKKTLSSLYQHNAFVLVCGGGMIARQYISILREEKANNKKQSLAGIDATRTNARFVMRVFGKDANDKLPSNMKTVKNNLSKNNVVVCGALRYRPDQTSDSTAAELAAFLGAEFINITNVDGLYTADPKTHPKATYIPHISWEAFAEKAKKIEFKPGQHFVLDQKAARLIQKEKIPTYIIGPHPHNLKKLIQGSSFKGTTITC